jgi:hypothetical protein
MEMDLGAVPKSTKDKYSPIIAKYNDNLNKYRKLFSELKATRNKTEKYENKKTGVTLY